MFLGLLFRFMKSKLYYRALENPYGRFNSKKYRKFEIFFYFLIYFKLCTKVDEIVVVYDKYFLVELLMFLSFPKWRKTMEIWKNTRFFMTFLR